MNADAKEPDSADRIGILGGTFMRSLNSILLGTVSTAPFLLDEKRFGLGHGTTHDVLQVFGGEGHL